MSGWIQTHTGRQFWPLEPKPEDVCIDDIAHALSMKCRFTGHTKEFYSVAQHSVFCSEIIAAFGGSPELQMAALLHDASEAYLPDVARPTKASFLVASPRFPDFKTFREIEDEILAAVAEAFGLNAAHFADPKIKDADVVMLMTERRDLMSNPPQPWATEAPHLWTTIYPQAPNQAKTFFLARFRKLKALLPEITIVTDGTAS